MAEPISALDYRPSDFIRELGPGAIEYYVEELSGLYLPDEFVAQHSNRMDVELWQAKDRLRGKFGRFVLMDAETDREVEGDEGVADVIVVGTTVGLHGLDRDGFMHSLRHYELGLTREVIESRGLDAEGLYVKKADYGATTIVLQDGVPAQIKVEGQSLDFGRADAAGRQKTCEVFDSLLVGAVEVVNVDPDPRPGQRIIR